MNWQQIKRYIEFHIKHSRIGTIIFNAKDIHEPITKAVNDLSKTIQGKRNDIVNPEAISDPIVEAQNATTEAVKAIPRIEIPKTDFTPLEDKIEALKKVLEGKEMVVNQGDVNVDLKPLLKAIEKLPKTFPKQEQIDYTLMLDELMKILERPKDHSEMIKLQDLVKRLGTSEDLAVLAEWLRVISEKEYPEFPEFPRDKNGIPLFTPTKVGGGGGGGLTSLETGYLKDIADNIGNVDEIETKLDALIAKDFATQTTLAAVLAKIIAAPATESKQDTINASINIQTSTTPTIYNITMTSANTEYSQALPAGTKQFQFRCRGLYDVRYAFTTGKVATPTAPYLTLSAGMKLHEDKLNLNSQTLYLACGTASQTVELLVWA